MLLSLLIPAASAFCGTFVSVGDDAPTNSGSYVSVVQQAGLTTLTMANDIHGSVGDFAMVIPVPSVLPEESIHVVDPAVFDHLIGYSAARLVSYDCEDFEVDTADYADSGADGGGGGEEDTATVVEAQYVVGEYNVVILSASESSSLLTWLQNNGYTVPAASAELLAEYIAGGSYFLAAQVRADAGVVDGDRLSPLQLIYADTGGSLPIRLGTLNSPGAQDLTIFGATDLGAGQLAIANYPPSTIETDCMLPTDTNFGEYVDGVIDAALPTTGEAHWITEYAWDNGNCDPCTPDGTLTETDLASMGFTPDYHYGYAYTFTRLHIRYTPEQATQDLVLYAGASTGSKQLRYIEYNPLLEDRFPVCGQGYVDDPGSCDDTAGSTDSGSDDVWTPTGARPECGCGAGAAGAGLVWLAVVGGLTSRRRRAR